MDIKNEIIKALNYKVLLMEDMLLEVFRALETINTEENYEISDNLAVLQQQLDQLRRY